jgi:flavin-dependent dehydrogenase
MRDGVPSSVDVLVVGGGPAGLATAIAARSRGLTVAVADGAIPPIDKACGEGLMPDGVQALLDLGIAIPEDRSYPFRGIRFLNRGTEVEAPFPRGVAYGIRRTHLHQVMTAHATACGVRILWQTPVTELYLEGAVVGGETLRARWVVGADGTNSRVRKWASLEQHDWLAPKANPPRFAFRRHYQVAPWSEFMELHWGLRGQVYVTPVSQQEVCVAFISSNAKLRLKDGLAEFPELRARLHRAAYASTERGAVTTTRSLRRVYRGHSVLVGDASGGVDSITGEGLCLAFRQAALLAECMAHSDLARYQRGHRKLARRPALMAHMMLFLASHARIRRQTMKVFRANPRSFAGLLALHLGDATTRLPSALANPPESYDRTRASSPR